MSVHYKGKISFKHMCQVISNGLFVCMLDSYGILISFNLFTQKKKILTKKHF